MRLLVLALFSALLSSTAFAQSDASQPLNILWIMSDQHSVRAMSTYENGFGGLTEPITPNLDSLASEGMRFDRAYCVTTGWWNPLLDRLGVFPRLERALKRSASGPHGAVQ